MSNVKVARAYLSSQVYGLLREKILEGQLGPGEKVVIADLVAEFEVSRTPIRDAINRLIGDGLLTAVPGSTVIVSPLSDADVRDTLELRLLVELYAAEKGLELITPLQLEKMQSLLDEMGSLIGEEHYEDLQRFVQLDQDFHSIIVELAQNSRLTQIYESLNAHMQILRTMYLRKLGGREKYRPRVIHQAHQMIFQACKDKDGELLKSVLATHIKKVGEDLLRFFNVGEEYVDWLKGHDFAIWIAPREQERR